MPASTYHLADSASHLKPADVRKLLLAVTNLSGSLPHQNPVVVRRALAYVFALIAHPGLWVFFTTPRIGVLVELIGDRAFRRHKRT